MRIARLRIPATVFLVAVSLAGCNDLTSSVPLGHLSVKVVDASNVGVQGVAADLYKLVDGGALLWRAASTNSAGIAVFGASDGGVVTGQYYIHVRFTTLHQLAAGETNDKAVTVGEGDDLTVTFHAVAASGPGQGP